MKKADHPERIKVEVREKGCCIEERDKVKWHLLIHSMGCLALGQNTYDFSAEMLTEKKPGWKQIQFTHFNANCIQCNLNPFCSKSSLFKAANFFVLWTNFISLHIKCVGTNVNVFAKHYAKILPCGFSYFFTLFFSFIFLQANKWLLISNTCMPKYSEGAHQHI